MPLTQPTRLYSDSKSAICIVNNPVQHDRMKHVKIDRNFIQREIGKGGIKLVYIPTAEQVPDVLTKAMSRPGFETLISKLGMRNIYSLPRGGVLESPRILRSLSVGKSMK